MPTTVRIQSATFSGMFQAVATVDRTKVHLWDNVSGARTTLPLKSFPFCELDSQSIVTITVTRATLEEEQQMLPGLEGIIPPGQLS